MKDKNAQLKIADTRMRDSISEADTRKLDAEERENLNKKIRDQDSKISHLQKKIAFHLAEIDWLKGQVALATDLIKEFR